MTWIWQNKYKLVSEGRVAKHCLLYLVEDIKSGEQVDLVLTQIDSYCAAVVVARGKLVEVLRVLPKKYEEYFSSHYKLLTEYERGPHHSLSCIVQEVHSGYKREVVFIPLGTLMAVVFTEPGQIVCIGVQVQPAPRATMFDWGWKWRGGLVESTTPDVEVPQNPSLPPA